LKASIQAGGDPGQEEQPRFVRLNRNENHQREDEDGIQDDDRLTQDPKLSHAFYDSTGEALGPTDFEEIHRRYHQGLGEGRQGVVGCLVVRPDGRIFSQRRSLTRATFPGCWDLVGGHVEAGESPLDALRRELREETGWTLESVLGLLKVVDWETSQGGPRVLKREFVFVVTIQGDWESPLLEPQNVIEGRWFSEAEKATLHENRIGTDRYVYDTFEEFWRRLSR